MWMLFIAMKLMIANEIKYYTVNIYFAIKLKLIL
jgi:hypothetical protein